MIANVLETIQTEFQTNWVTTDIQFGDDNMNPTTQSWIRLDIIPLGTNNASYSGNLDEYHGCYITSYARNQMQASLLADQVSNFFQNRTIDNVRTFNYQPKDQGPIIGVNKNEGVYYVKTFYRMRTLCG